MDRPITDAIFKSFIQLNRLQKLPESKKTLKKIKKVMNRIERLTNYSFPNRIRRRAFLKINALLDNF